MKIYNRAALVGVKLPGSEKKTPNAYLKETRRFSFPQHYVSEWMNFELNQLKLNCFGVLIRTSTAAKRNNYFQVFVAHKRTQKVIHIARNQLVA